MNNFGWIEIVFFYGIAIGFGVWQVWKTDKLLKQTRAERVAREAEEASWAEGGDYQSKTIAVEPAGNEVNLLI
mgnify:CR=1 FL=1